ncbi:hypothetical protein [Stenotrophomonas sp. YAU14D1_LEIMI4_1]|uniref:hypothetical protein n=1 Tax=Stenotrophomonas sp. YAU14D1_LEIMI4_1 TaxID=2072407 RepID=UPI000D540240|nr:hypothetical protein [Stenotrophomonas sp. YAU14D1_LEIMI4_1]AWH24715.1 hypothetical protein C1932_06115 [Stenotrophomonas sp. YAU14D1_LEIMI4_1]
MGQRPRHCRRACLIAAALLLAAQPFALAQADPAAEDAQPAIVGVQVRGVGRFAHGEQVPLPRVLQALGAPVQREPSPYECGSAYDHGDIQLLSWAGQAWESNGQTAVLRRFEPGREGALVLSNGQRIDLRSTGASVMQRLPRAHASDGTVHVTADPRGRFEERYDLRFDAQGRLFQVDYWIAC